MGILKTILLVEKQGDSSVSRNAGCKKDLEKLGYSVITAETGEQAFKLVDSGAVIDLILMDADLGDGMDGMQTAEQMLEKKDVPLLFLLSNPDAETLHKVERVRSYGFVTRYSTAAEWDLSFKIALRLFESKKNIKSDLAKRKQAEEVLRETEQKLRTLFEDSPVTIMIHDKDTGKVVDANEKAYKSYGLSSLAELQKNEFWSDPPYSVEEALQWIRRAAHEVQTFEWKNRNIHGEEFWEQVTLRLIVTGGVERILSVAVDITERKRVEEALRKSEAYSRSILELIPDIIIRCSSEGECLDISGSRESEEKLYRPKKELLGKKIGQVLPKTEASRFMQGIKQSIMTQTIQSLQYELETPAGKLWFEARIIPSYSKEVLTLIRDISEAKKTEIKLKENEVFIKHIMDNLPVGIAVNTVDPVTEASYMNDKFPEIYRTTRQALKDPNSFWDAVYEDPVFRKQIRERVLADCASGEQSRMFWPDIPIKRKGEPTAYVSAMNAPLPGTQQMISTVWDVTDRKQAELKLKESEEKHRRLFETMSQGVIYQAADEKIISANPSAEQMLGLSVDQMMDKTSMDPRWQMIYEDGSAVSGSDHPTMIALRTGEKIGPVTRGIFIPEEEEYVWLSITAIPLFQPGEDKPFQAYATFDDITERKRAEHALKKAVKEKEVLLSEIHHRVKNNMAIISSLITFQTDFADRKKAPEKVLRDIQTRIESMALVHEMVYEHQNFAEIDAGKLLKRISDHLKRIYQIKDLKVTVQIRADDLRLDMNKSVPFTLLASEILTNAFKHAFADRKTGLIEINLEKENGGYRLVIQDNGVGVSDIKQLQNAESFGYTIIQGLAKQLRADLEVASSPDGGLRVEAQFPEKIS